jgi:hypothetical protein
VVVVVVALGALGACGGGDDGGGDGDAASAGDATTTTPAEGASSQAAEVPKFLDDLERVCTTQVGFPGVAAYEAAPGTHPVVLFEDYRGEGFVQSSRTLPGGWAVEQDADYEDTKDLEVAQLVACSDRVAEHPTGVTCEFKDDDDPKGVELELVDATYQLKVYEATTGKLQHEQTLEAKNTTCPYFATFKKGDTTFVNQPSDDDYTNALKPVVAPG